MTGHRHSAGFTLVELMVSIAILMTLMSGLVVLFVGSMRAVKQGYQTMEAIETARGALNIIEWDLTTSFASRQYGQYYTFFGIPAGMTFVGVVGGDDGINLSRVTYVLHEFDPRPCDGLDNDLDGQIDEADECTVADEVFDTTMFVTLINRFDPSDRFLKEVRVLVRTRTLLRYVEPNVKDLDSFPYNWPDPLSSAVPEWTPEQRHVWEELHDTVWRGGVNLLDVDVDFFPELASGVETGALAQELLKAKKRELWIRMLAGEWLNPDWPLPDMWTLLDEHPADYVVAQNILWQIERIEPVEPQYRVYVEYEEDPGKNHWEYINASGQNIVEEYNHWGGNDGVDNNGDGRVDEIDGDKDGRGEQRLYGFSSFMYGRTAYGRLDEKPWFNTEDNLPGYIALQDGDLDTFWAEEAAQDVVGDPLKPRLPELVEVHFRLMFESPYPGAPDFDRPFSLLVGIPSGFTRAHEEAE